MDEHNNLNPALSGYDQKAFLQIRLHELLSKIDNLGFESVGVNIKFQSYFQKAIFTNLSNVFATISSKLTKEELQLALNKRKEIQDTFKKFPITKNGMGPFGNNVTHYSYDSLEIIIDGLLEFRLLLEQLMDKHGFNPSKENVGRSIAKQ